MLAERSDHRLCRLPLAAVMLSGVLACGGGANGPGSDAAPPPDAPAVAADAAPIAEECLKPANVARKQQLEGAQPTLAARAKQLISAPVTFASLAGDPSVTCSVTLRFKDLNGNAALDGYENWTLGAEQRAADLVARLGAEQKLGLMAHATMADVPAGASPAPSARTRALIDAGIRFGRTAASTAPVASRAAWANAVQELAEAQGLGIPFVLSMAPSHSTGNGRVLASGFSQWPDELSLGATGDPAVVERFGATVAQEYRAIGVRMALSPPADLLTDPRWFNGQFTFGEDSAAVAAMVAAYVKGAQGTSLGPTSVACVVGQFPGAGAAKEGWDARLQKGKYLAYAGGNIDAHLAPFGKAFEDGVAGVMPAYGILEAGGWTGLGGLLAGASVEQVGASFNGKLLTDVLRGHYHFGGLVLSPWGILDDAGVDPLGAPWGVESLTRAQRAAKAVNAGVDQLGGLDDVAPLVAARAAGTLGDARIDAAAGRALALMFKLGLFENPYVDAAQAPALCNTDGAYRAGLDAANRGLVLLMNAAKPAGWLNGNGDGTQVGDKGNAGNGSRKVLPAPPGEPYVSAGCSYFIMGNFDLDYVRSVSTGYGDLTNDATVIKNVPVTTAAERIALSDYVFIRVDAPFSSDADSGALNLCRAPLSYAGNDDAAALADVAFARAAIDGWSATHALPSQAQIIVGVDGGRPSVVDEILGHGVSGLYLEWFGTGPAKYVDKIFLDVAFGIVHGVGKLPAGVPRSDAAAAQQMCDLPGDGQHATFVRGFGLQTARFE